MTRRPIPRAPEVTPLTAHTAGWVDLNPGYLADGSDAIRRRRSLIDVAALLNFMILTLFLLPAELIVPPLTAVGRPALLVSLLLTAVWVASKLHPRFAMTGPQPMRVAAVFYLVAFLMSYAAGILRGLTTLEANATDRTFIFVCMYLGVILAAADGVANRRRLDDVVRTLVWCAAAMAALGLVEFALSFDVTRYITVPGLVMQGDLEGLEGRGDGFSRVASTAGNYIEFSSVMAMSLPFAIHLARFGGRPRTRQAAAICALLMTAAIPVTLTRTGILALVVMTVAMLPAWPWRVRFNIGIAAAALVAATVVAVPGLLGTIVSLFTNISGDPSIEGRTDDYAAVSGYIAERLWLGRGPGTFIPKLYIVLDNQWLGTLVDSGVVGVAALAAMHLTAIWLAALALRRSPAPADRHLCACLIAAQVVAVAVGGTFDSLGFTTFATVLALLTGLSGAMWRLTHPTRQVRTRTQRGSAGAPQSPRAPA